MSLLPVKLDPSARLQSGRMLLTFTGWMDGGDVSTGVGEWLVPSLGAQPVGRIDAEDCYLFQMPGSMEQSTAIRPRVDMERGQIRSMQMPANTLHVAHDQQLAIFQGHEPNLRWNSFADTLVDVARRLNVTELYFVGSFAGSVPHTRQPRLFCAASDDALLASLRALHLTPSSYEGPASFATYLLTRMADTGMKMASIVAEIPAYVQGRNPTCIEAALQKLAVILDLPLRTDELREAGDEFEKRVTEAVAQEEELAEHITKLESDYDHHMFEQMGDLKTWLQQKSVRID